MNWKQSGKILKCIDGGPHHATVTEVDSSMWQRKSYCQWRWTAQPEGWWLSCFAAVARRMFWVYIYRCKDWHGQSLFLFFNTFEKGVDMWALWVIGIERDTCPSIGLAQSVHQLILIIDHQSCPFVAEEDPMKSFHQWLFVSAFPLIWHLQTNSKKSSPGDPMTLWTGKVRLVSLLMLLGAFASRLLALCFLCAADGTCNACCVYCA